MDPLERRQQQSRSYSISGQEFQHLNYAGQMRANQNVNFTPQQIPFGDSQMQMHLTRSHQNPSSYLHANLPVRRPPSPMTSISYQTPHNSYMHDQAKFGPDVRISRNHLHASLESINSNPHLIEHQYHQMSQHLSGQNNRHYAASYILAAPPANTVINQSGDHDLAAAAMGPDPPRFNSIKSDSISLKMNPYGFGQQLQSSPYKQQVNQFPQSPLKRTNGTTSSINMSVPQSTHLSANLSSPIRGGYSSLSLASSSVIIEEKLQNEIKKLQSELRSEKEKNEALNSQLNINVS